MQVWSKKSIQIRKYYILNYQTVGRQAGRHWANKITNYIHMHNRTHALLLFLSFPFSLSGCHLKCAATSDWHKNPLDFVFNLTSLILLSGIDIWNIKLAVDTKHMHIVCVTLQRAHFTNHTFSMRKHPDSNSYDMYAWCTRCRTISLASRTNQPTDRPTTLFIYYLGNCDRFNWLDKGLCLRIQCFGFKTRTHNNSHSLNDVKERRVRK